MVLMKKFPFKYVLITGASSGIGKAIAIQLANENIVLYLNGRNEQALIQTKEECVAKGAIVHIQILDVRYKQKMKEWICSLSQIDLVCACAGVSASTLGTSNCNNYPEDPTIVYPLIETNLMGVLNTILPAITVINHQKPKPDGYKGNIAVIASVAAFFSSPWSPSYCASKAAVDRFVMANGGILKRMGIHLTSVCCGFVKTSLTEKNQFIMPGIVKADQAALNILYGIISKKRRIVFPLWLVILVKILDLLPSTFLEKITMHFFKQAK